jgi:tetratricopeptide (TPR) repeat protein
MHLPVSTVEKSCLRRRFLAILILDVFLDVGLTAWAPNANAQVYSLENADGEISGTVLVDADKRPAREVAVSLRSSVGGIFCSVLTDLEGHFKVQNLPRGTYEIAVDEEGYESAQTSAHLDGHSSKLVLYLKSRPGAIPTNGYTVSVRELKIPDKARSELQKGLERMAKNDPAGSLSHFTNATQAFPGYFEAYNNIGSAQTALGHFDEAMRAFQTSIDLSGGRYARAEFGYGYLLCLEGKPGEAEKIIRRGLETEDSEPDGYVILSEVLVRLNRLDEAEKSAHEALLRNPKFGGAYLALSVVAEKKGDYRAEIRDLDALLKLQPNGPGSAQIRRVREGALKMLAQTQPAN